MRIIEKLDLTELNSYRVHSLAHKAYFPETEIEIIEAASLPGAIIIGGGCNVIFSQESYENPIVFIRDNFSGVKRIDDSTLVAKAGTDLKELSEIACEMGLTGLEYYYDIPGCVGGATVMNAGCQGVSLGDYIGGVKYYDLDAGRISQLGRANMDFGYRKSFFLERKTIVLETVLDLTSGNKDEIREKMESNKIARWQKQPRLQPSAGSVFKRPPGRFVGPMITELGLKGYKIGGAQISEKHAGFIVNCGNATGKDILALIDVIKESVFDKFDLELELEQRVI